MKTLLIVSLLIGASPVFAIQDCESGGKDINLSNGWTTEKLTGLVTCRDRDTKKIEREMKYVNGKETWQRYYHYDSGKPKSERFVNQQGNTEGIAKEFYESGKLKSECSYVNAQEHGLCKRFYESGKPESTAFYVSDRERTQLTYNEDGSLHELQCSTGSFSKLDRELCGYAGKTSAVPLYYSDKSKPPYRKVGYLKGDVVAVTLYDEKGNVESHSEGGLTTSKWPNGKNKAEKRVSDEELHGAQREFAESGQLTKESEYDKGFLKTEKEFYLNGQMKQLDEKKKDGQKVATVSKSFWDNGQLKREGRYVDRQPVGAIKTFHEDGTLMSEETYGDDGQLTGMSKQYFDDGKKIAREVAYEKGRMTRLKEYDESGKLLVHEEYFADGSKKAYKKRQ